MKIKGGWGYYETDKYPIGGCFNRAPQYGIELKEKIRDITPSYKGCDVEYMTIDGKKVAFGYASLDKGE